MGKRSARRRKAKIKSYMAEHGISKHTQAARAVDGCLDPADVPRCLPDGTQRGTEGKTSIQIPAALFDTVRAGLPIANPETAARSDRTWRRLYGRARELDGLPAGWTVRDCEVLDWLVRSARTDNPALIAAWLERHGRVLTAPEQAVLAGLVQTPHLRMAAVWSAPDDDPAALWGRLDKILAAGVPDPAVWPDAFTNPLAVTPLRPWQERRAQRPAATPRSGSPRP